MAVLKTIPLMYRRVIYILDTLCLLQDWEMSGNNASMQDRNPVELIGGYLKFASYYHTTENAQLNRSGIPTGRKGV